MGILASMVDFSFSCCGFFDVAGAGLDGERAASSSWKPVFPAARGCQGAKLAGGDAHGAPLTAPSRRKSYEHEIEGAAVGRRWRDCADRVDSAFHEFRLWLFESFDPGPSLSNVLVDSRNNLTFGRRVSATAP